jgi:hypothetical protein
VCLISHFILSLAFYLVGFACQYPNTSTITLDRKLTDILWRLNLRRFDTSKANCYTRIHYLMVRYNLIACHKLRRQNVFTLDEKITLRHMFHKTQNERNLYDDLLSFATFILKLSKIIGDEHIIDHLFS